MKLFTSLLVILGLVIALGLWVNHSLENTAEALAQNVWQITEEVEADSWQKAEQHLNALEKEWNNVGRWWPVVLDHQEIDNIEFALAKLKEYVAEKNRVLSLGQLSELKLMILHLPEREAITIKNIL